MLSVKLKKKKTTQHMKEGKFYPTALPAQTSTNRGQTLQALVYATKL